MLRDKGFTRLAAIQALYQRHVLSNLSDEDLMSQFKDRYLNKPVDWHEFSNLIQGAKEHYQTIDIEIDKYLYDHISDISIINRIIIQLGIFELKTYLEVPPSIIISAYINYSVSLGTNNSHILTNSILDKYLKAHQKLSSV